MYVKVLLKVNLMNFQLSVCPSKELIGDHTRQGEKFVSSTGVELTTSEFDQPLLYRLIYEVSIIAAYRTTFGDAWPVDLIAYNEQ